MDINNKKFKPITLSENFIIFDNIENLICNRNIVNKVQFQEHNNGYANIYFINKSLGEFLLNNKFVGFELIPVKKINTDETIFYQMKVINVVEQPNIKTEIPSLFDNSGILYPSKNSNLYKFFKKDKDVCIYTEEYIRNDFKDFNISYYAFEDSSNKSNTILTRPELIVSKRAMLLLKQHKSKFAIEPIYSTENTDLSIFELDKEIKKLIEKCK